MLSKQGFKIWLATNGLNQKQVAEKLQITEGTIVKYNNNGRYPKQFEYALIGIAYELNKQ